MNPETFPLAEKLFVDMDIMNVQLIDASLDAAVSFADLFSAPIELTELQKDCYTECESLIGEIKGLWSNGMYEAVQSVARSVDFANKLRRKSKKPFGSQGESTQQQFIQDFFTQPIDEEMKDVIAIESNLATTSSTLKSIIDRLTKLILSLEQYSNLYENLIVYFQKGKDDLKSLKTLQKFYLNLKERTENTVKVIVNTRSIFKNKIAFMGELKVQSKLSFEKDVSKEDLMKAIELKETSQKNSLKKSAKNIVRVLIVLLKWLWEVLDETDADTIYNAISNISISQSVVENAVRTILNGL